MAKKKRKKHPRLPNGFGSVRFLGGTRKNPYAVHPAGDIDGNRPPAICYVDDWYRGFAVLTAYNAGTYKPGMENEILVTDTKSIDTLCARIMADYNRAKGIEEKTREKTFKEVYDLFFEWKYGGKKQLSVASKRSTSAAFRNASSLHDKIYSKISHDDYQAVIDDCPLKHASLELILSLFKQMARFARAQHIIPDCGAVELLRIGIDDDDISGVPFTPEEMQIIWNHKDDPTAEMILIMCYSGFRISEYREIEINTEQWYFRGGLKTDAGKGRTVPIHSSIQQLVLNRIRRNKKFMSNINAFRADMYNFLESVGIDKHTPHDCRDTFATLGDRFKVDKVYLKRMLGHSLAADITENKYIHPELEDMRAEIEKIICDFTVTYETKDLRCFTDF